MATQQELAGKGKQAIQLSDKVIRDLKIPIMATVLELQDQLFLIADDLGIGEPVRALVYSIRGASYVGTTAGSMMGVHAGAGVAAAGSTVAASVLSFGTLGAVGLVVGIALLFGGPDSDEQEANLKKAQATIRHLADRLSLAGFAADQDQIKKDWGVDTETHRKRGAEAGLMAEFYRRAQAELSGYRKDVFECLSNIARWEVVLTQFKAMSHEDRSTVTGIGFGTSKPTDYFATVVGQKLALERTRLDSLARHKPKPRIVLELPGGLGRHAASFKSLGVFGVLAYAAYKFWRSRG